MNLKRLALVSAISFPLVLVGCGDDGDEGPQGEQGSQGPQGEQGLPGEDATSGLIALSLLGRYSSGVFDESAAEIVDFDPATQQTYVVNANSGQIDILDASEPAAPTLVTSLDVAAVVAAEISGSADNLGAVNSVSVSGDYLAVALEADPKTDNGYVAFYQTDGTFVTALEAGALPDMVTFTPDGDKVLVANEGEPNGDYSIDPEGSVTIIDVSGGVASVTDANVSQVSFAGATLTGEVRISAKAASVEADLEPEYVVVSEDSSMAYVLLQENNAVAVIDLLDDTLDEVIALGFKDYSIPGNEFDASNRDGGANIRNWPVFGVYMPDGADAYTYDGTTYIVTANEGDGREYLTDAVDAADCTAQGGFDFDDGDCFHYLDEIRIKDIQDGAATIDASLFSRAGADLEEDENLGRLKIMTDLGLIDASTCVTLATTGQPDAGCDYEAFYSYGARSFTIWNADNGQPVFDSGNQFEVITANRLPNNFNASNDDNEGDDRSDDKGPEPEAIEIGVIEGRTYAFIGLERVGGIMVYNITNPESAEFVQYINERDFSSDDLEADLATVGDLGPESIKFVAAGDSPTSNPMLIVGNEVSGTTSFFEIRIVSQ